jgi:hypothetical protein
MEVPARLEVPEQAHRVRVARRGRGVLGDTVASELEASLKAHRLTPVDGVHQVVGPAYID